MLILYTQPRCTACDTLREHLNAAGHFFVEVDIADDPALRERYAGQVPLLAAGNGQTLAAPHTQDPTQVAQFLAGLPQRSVSRANTIVAGGMLAALTTMLGVWVTLPWLAPIFAKLGWWGPADAIYTAYIFFCHQLPERAAQLFSYQVAWCWRNTALYTSLFFTALLYLGNLTKLSAPSGQAAREW